MEALVESITLADAWAWVLAAAAAIVAISKAVEVVHKHFRPDLDLREDVDKITDRLSKNDVRIKVLEEAREKNCEFEAVMCEVMLAQLNHELSGNDVERLRSARDRLQMFLANRG